MKLEKKKALVARALKIGKNRVVLNSERLSEVKEAITKQDIKDLLSSGAITIKETKGRKAIVKRKGRRRMGSVRKKVKNSKRKYMILTRKLRAHLKNLKSKSKISQEEFLELRREIRASLFKDLSRLKERISQIKEDKKWRQ